MADPLRLAVDHHRPDPARDRGTTVVWMHGFLSDRGGEKATRLRERMLASGRGFTAFDFRAHGGSPGEMRDLTCAGLLEDAAAVIGPLAGAGRRVVPVGSSMGAWTAAWHSVLVPGSAAALVLVAPALRWPAVLADEAGPEAAARWEREGTVEHDAGFARVTLGWELVRGGRDYPAEALAARFAAPALIVHGTGDASCDWRESVRFAAECAAPDVEVLLLKGVDHRLTGRRDRLADAVEGFLGARGL